MKNTRFPTFVMAVAILTLLSGCISSNQPTLIPVSMTETVEALPTGIKPTSTSTLTFTSISPLKISDAYARVSQFLNNSSDCRLPCWLGIKPGQSALLDVSEQLKMFNNIATDSSYGVPAGDWLVASLTIPYSSDDDKVMEIKSSYLNTLGENDISVTEFYTRTYGLKAGKYDGDVYGYPAYSELLKPYTISGVLSNYGPPDQIYVVAYLRSDTLITPGFGDHFDLHVWYPNQGIFITYKMSVEASGDNYRFCPSSAFVSGTLMPSDLGTGYQEVLLKLGDRYQGFFPPSVYVKTLTEAFGMTIDEFYQLFRSPTDRCLETPKSLWWP